MSLGHDANPHLPTIVHLFEIPTKVTLLPDSDIYRLAHDFLREHQDAAGPKALREAEMKLGQGDMDGYTRWWRIAKAVEHIQRMERKTDMVP